MAYQAFISSTKLEDDKNALRQARQQVLEKAQERYEQRKEREDKERQEGRNDWMLPAVSARLDGEEKLNSSKIKKKKKKEKKKKRKVQQSSASESDEEGDAEEWVEKAHSVPRKTASPPARISGPQLQRDSWMECPMDLVPTYSKEDIRRRREAEEEKTNAVEEPGQHARELNPYWRDGGTGLPPEKSTSHPEARVHQKTGVLGGGDGGLVWLLKARQRCKELAAEQGRSEEEVAAERWGSLEKLESQIAEARRAQDRGHERSTPWKRSRSPDRAGGSGYEKECWSWDRDRGKGRSHHSRDGERGIHGDRTYDRRSKFLKPSESESTPHPRDEPRYKREGSARDGQGHYSYKKPSQTAASSCKSSKFLCPREMEDGNEQASTSKAGSGRWRVGADERSSDPTTGRGRSGGERQEGREGRGGPGPGGQPRWRKAGHSQEEEGADVKSNHKPSLQVEHKELKSSSDSSDSVESSDGDDSPAPERILSEDELNALGAKLLRAELMGDETQAATLRGQLQRARTAREQHLATGASTSRPPPPEEQVAVLTRTSKTGVVYPLSHASCQSQSKGKRRREGKVDTHGKQGQRLRYFDDDDKFGLKEMVAQEKMGTAEDQNTMFARLAGRAATRTDDDFQMDDMFMERAARKQNQAGQEERERARAVMEHHKVQSTMDKCNFCFNNVPKHLIIAIGTKVYLCLPNHRSLTEGHCLVVPMQHSSAGTALDEDVWQEMQMFRKCLVQMFAAREQDCVFMETVMGLRRFPHMALECVPLEKELGDVAPIYFKKAIQESEKEWSDNIKLIDMSKKDIRRAVPKGLPYFSVDFGLQGGFAHVIEDEARFPSYFGREILGGMLDCDTRLWRKPQRENFDDQRRKVLQFEQWWRPFDWTSNLAKA